MCRVLVSSAAAIALFALMGCASATPQADVRLTARRDEPRSFKIDNVPYIQQAAGHCGPATLAMVMQSYDRTVTIDALVEQVYTPSTTGTFQADMIGATRRNAMLAIPIEGLSALLSEVAAGHPVIVFENLALSWLPKWHYAVVFGYDLDRETVLMHSGPEANKIWDIRKFERSWKLGDYWGLVVIPPDRLSASADELSHAKAAAGLEQAGHTASAYVSYRTMLKKWPTSLTALIGLSNKFFEDGRFRDSVQLLTKATIYHPSVASAWHNRSHAEAAARLEKPAKASAARALQLVDPDLRSQYEESLADILR